MCVLQDETLPSVHSRERQSIYTFLQVIEPCAVVTFTAEAEAQEFSVKTANSVNYRITFFRDDVFRVDTAPKGPLPIH